MYKLCISKKIFTINIISLIVTAIQYFVLLKANYVSDLEVYSNHYAILSLDKFFSYKMNIGYSLFTLPFTFFIKDPLLYFSLMTGIFFNLFLRLINTYLLNIYIGIIVFMISFYPLVLSNSLQRAKLSLIFVLFLLIKEKSIQSKKKIKKSGILTSLTSILIHPTSILFFLPLFFSRLRLILLEMKNIFIYGRIKNFIILFLFFAVPTFIAIINFILIKFLFYINYIDNSFYSLSSLMGSILFSAIILYFANDRLAYFFTLITIISFGLIIGWLGRLNIIIYLFTNWSIISSTKISKKYKNIILLLFSMFLLFFKGFDYLNNLLNGCIMNDSSYC